MVRFYRPVQLTPVCVTLHLRRLDFRRSVPPPHCLAGRRWFFSPFFFGLSEPPSFQRQLSRANGFFFPLIISFAQVTFMVEASLPNRSPNQNDGSGARIRGCYRSFLIRMFPPFLLAMWLFPFQSPLASRELLEPKPFSEPFLFPLGHFFALEFTPSGCSSLWIEAPSRTLS